MSYRFNLYDLINLIGSVKFQLSDEEKADVPEHVRRAARAQADQALRDRLKEIKMSQHDHEQYSVSLRWFTGFEKHV